MTDQEKIERINGKCCRCRYTGSEETCCPAKKDDEDQHCIHWYEGPDESPMIDGCKRLTDQEKYPLPFEKLDEIETKLRDSEKIQQVIDNLTKNGRVVSTPEEHHET